MYWDLCLASWWRMWSHAQNAFTRRSPRNPVNCIKLWPLPLHFGPDNDGNSEPALLNITTTNCIVNIYSQKTQTYVSDLYSITPHLCCFVYLRVIYIQFTRTPVWFRLNTPAILHFHFRFFLPPPLTFLLLVMYANYYIINN